MKTGYAVYALIIAGLVLCTAAWAEQAGQTRVTAETRITHTVEAVVEPIGKAAQVNWTQGTVTVTARGIAAQGTVGIQARETARRAAIVVAQRDLAEAIYGVSLRSVTEVEKAQLVKDTIRTELQAFVQGARIIAERELTPGAYEVTMAVPLYGVDSVAEVVVPQIYRRPESGEQPGQPAQRTPLTEEQKQEAKLRVLPVPPPQPEQPAERVPAAEQQQGPFTGLIVDCRGFGVKPSMSPKILDADGREVWGTMNIDPDLVIAKGIVGYARSMEEARANGRVGANPLTVRAIGRAGNYQDRAVVTNDDATRILREDGQTHFLDQLAVVFIVDPRQ